MSERLLPCPSCNRHIRVSEAQCPFCAGAVPVGFGGGAQRARPAPRLSRAALFTLGSLAVTPVACVGESTDEDQEDADEDADEDEGAGGAATAAGGENSQAVYGAPVDGGSANSSGGESSSGGDTSQPEYGAPASTGGDQQVPIYGAAPVGRELPGIKK